MTDHTPTSGDLSNTDADKELQARLAEIEAGLLNPYTFTSRTLIQATFPHSSKAGDKIVLVNGNMQVTMFSPDGLPYGVYPRLIMCWLTEQAIRRKDLPIDEARTIALGSSLSQFMREIGMQTASGGKDGNIARLRKQLAALFATFISVKMTGTCDREDMPRSFQQIDNTMIAESAMLWWDPKRPDQMGLQDSTVTLSEAFFRDLVGSAVPLDTSILRSIRRSPMAIDVYCWLTYRLSYHRYITVVTWDQLREQFGTGYPDTSRGRLDFKRNIKLAFGKVATAWPGVSAEITGNGIMLKAGSPSVPKKVQDALKRYQVGDNPF